MANGHMKPANDAQCYPIIEASVSNGTGGFTVYYTLKFWLRWGPVYWGSNGNHYVTCDGQSQNKSFAITNSSSTSSLTWTLASGSFWVSYTGSKTVTVEWYNNNMSVSYNGSYNGLSASVSVTGNGASSSSNCSAPSNFKATPRDAYCLVDRKTTVDLSWSKGSGGTNNSFSHTELEWSYSGSEPWHPWTTSTGTSITDTHGPGGVGHEAVYRARTVGSAGTGYASDWVNSNRFRLYPPPPTGLSLSLYTGSYFSYVYDDIIGSYVYLFQLNTAGGTNGASVLVKPSGGAAFDYYVVEYAVWSPWKNPKTDAPDLVNWAREVGEVSTAGYESGWNLNDGRLGGMWFQYRARTAHRAAGDTIYVESPTSYYSAICKAGGGITNKRSGSWKTGSCRVKVGGAWRFASMVWYKDGTTWKRCI